MNRYKLSLFLALFFIAIFMQTAEAHGAEIGASCSISVTTTRGTVELEGQKNDVMVWADETLNIAWEGDNALSAKDGMGKAIPVKGSIAIKPPLKKKTYIYRFKGDEGKQAVCAFTAYAIKAGFNTFSLTSTNPKPMIQGTVSGLKNVVVVIKKDDFNDVEAYRSRPIKIKNNLWSIRVPVSLRDGTYSIHLYAPQGFELNYIVSGTLTITSAGSPALDISTSFPQDRTVAGGDQVTIGYLTITNTSKGLATISNVWVKNNQSISDRAIIGLGIKDDQGGSVGGSGGIEGYTPFENGLASIPTNKTLSPAESRTFTLVAALSKDVADYVGKKIQIDILSIGTTAAIKGVFGKGTIYSIED